jgi:hypothetical protein
MNNHYDWGIDGLIAQNFSYANKSVSKKNREGNGVLQHLLALLLRGFYQ